MYKKNELMSAFIGIFISLGKNTIVEGIYRQPCMHMSEFILKDPFEILSHENKTIVLMEDFNNDLLKYDAEKDSVDFLESGYAGFLLPYNSTTSNTML